jgi:hypothetical protein
MNLLNSPILGTKVSLHSFTHKPKAKNKDTHKSRIIMMHKRVNSEAPNKLSTTTDADESMEPITKPCLCGRRHFIEAAATATLTTTQFPIQSATATNSDSDYTVIIPFLLLLTVNKCKMFQLCKYFNSGRVLQKQKLHFRASTK